MNSELRRVGRAYMNLNEEICQSLGKALGYPWFMADKKNFPTATEEDGVCVGDHVAESIAEEAANRINTLTTTIKDVRMNMRTVLETETNEEIRALLVENINIINRLF